jgi:3-oxoacyl-(acyl-carrier-protein) synthase
MTRPDIWVTGIGIVCPAGNNAGQAYRALCEGGRRVGRLERFRRAEEEPPIGARISDYSPPAGAESADPLTRYSLTAANEAITQAGLAETLRRGVDTHRTAVAFGTSKGGMHAFAEVSRRLRPDYQPAGQPSQLNDLIQAIPPDAPGRTIAERYDTQGPVHTTVAACSTGTLAIIRGAQYIADGDADRAICGSADASLVPLWFAAFERMGVLARPHELHGPEYACRPFDKNRNGFAVGEGAAVLVLESASAARSRGATPIACIRGWAMGADPTELTQVSPDGAPLAEVIRSACRNAGISSHDVACIHAHGTGTRLNDRSEAAAFHKALGSRLETAPVVSLKGSIGHLLGGAGAVETAIACLSLANGVSPGNATLLEPDPSLELGHLPKEASEVGGGLILKTSLGFGGHMAALVLDRAR